MLRNKLRFSNYDHSDLPQFGFANLECFMRMAKKFLTPDLRKLHSSIDLDELNNSSKIQNSMEKKLKYREISLILETFLVSKISGSWYLFIRSSFDPEKLMDLWEIVWIAVEIQKFSKWSFKKLPIERAKRPEFLILSRMVVFLALKRHLVASNFKIAKHLQSTQKFFSSFFCSTGRVKNKFAKNHNG